MHRTLPMLTGLSVAALSFFSTGQALAAEAQYQVRIPAHVQMSSTAPSADAADPLSVSVGTATLKAGTVGMPYTYDFTPLLSIFGGPEGGYNLGEVNWAVEAGGALPEGLSLSAAGVISGAPTQTGEYAFTVRASYKTASGAQSFSVRVNLPISFTLQSDAGMALGTVSYGKVPVGLKSDPVTLRLVNSSGMSVSNITPAFPADSPFFVESHNCAVILADNSYCTLKTRFSPFTLSTVTEALQITAIEGGASLGSFTGEGSELQVSVVGATGATEINADTLSDFNITLKNNSGVTVSIVQPTPEYSGGFWYETGGASIPPSGTATLYGKVMGGKGRHKVPFVFRSLLSGKYSPAAMYEAEFNITSQFNNTAVETFMRNHDLPDVFERIGYTGKTEYSNSSGISNSSSTPLGDSKALVIKTPSNSLSPNLYLYTMGTGNATVTIYEGSIGGSTILSHKFPSFSFKNIYLDLSPGKVYYVVPRNNGGSTANVYYASLRWN